MGKNGKATTLVELMIAVGIMSLVLAAVLAFLVTADKSWKIGQNKLVEQQQARAAMGDIVSNLQFASPNWEDQAGNNYPVTITNGRIDFYLPQFYPSCCPDNCSSQDLCEDSMGELHNQGEIAKLIKTTYKINPNKTDQLIKKEGISSEKIVANDVNRISFSCGCSGCATVDDDCPFVDISVTVEKEDEYNLESKIYLRNQGVTLSSDVEVQEPEEGEF